VNGTAPAIAAERLGRDYGETRALDALDLVVTRGEMVGLLGPNGAGKTTTMLLLATLLKPSRGIAHIFGYDVTRDRSAVREKLGLVFQDNTVDPLLTVSENLLFAARLAGLGGTAARVAVAKGMEWGKLVDRSSTPARQLSGGWRRVLDIVRALLHEPDLLVLDEPTVGLDPEHRERIWSLLENRRHHAGTSILFSTHYLAEAEPADRVVLLSQGRVVAADAPTTLKASIGVEVAEIEGPGAERLAMAFCGLGAVRTKIQMDRGFRVGLTGQREAAVELAGTAPGIVRFALRPATLEDVYFARTQPQPGTVPVTVA
jgi:ABC-type multidrug transport system ATPase subunit